MDKNNSYQELSLLVMEELLTSSSSDEEEINEALLRCCNKNKIPKIKNFIADVIDKFSEKDFRKHFRMCPQSAGIICNEYEASHFYKNSNSWPRGSEMTPAKTEFLLFLWFAGNKCTIRDVALKFGLSLSTAHKAIDKLMQFLVHVAPKYIRFPKTPEEKEHTSRQFAEISGFPSVIGCIDGTSINIITPAHKIKSTYVDRHDNPSLTLQGICDYRKCFIDVFTGVSAKIHDSRVLKLSDISTDLPAICGQNYHILGDSAYFIREWLLTPYKDYGNLSESEKHYNKKFCSTRVLIENSFGLLKSRFRQLMKIHMHKVDNISRFIVSCCVLHNICIFNNDLDEIIDIDETADEAEIAPAPPDNDANLRRLGELKRTLVKDRLFINRI